VFFAREIIPADAVMIGIGSEETSSAAKA